MTKILDNQKSTGGSPYAYYTVWLTTSNRGLYTIKANVNVDAHLASSSSSLGTGQSMGLNGYIVLNGKEYGPIELKETSESWSGTSTHSASASFTVDNLSVLQDTISNIKFRVSRTGTAEGDYSRGAALSSTSCSNISIAQAQAQSVFNSIISGATNETFSINATQYSLYDVLTIKNGNTVIKTIENVVSGVAYLFSSEEQTTLNALFGANESTKNLTATLTTYTDSTKSTNLGSTSLSMPIRLPSYVPIATLSSYTATDNYGAYKINSNDVIKGISIVGLTLTMSNNYDNTYSSATCNGVVGTINNRTITFSGITQADVYNVVATDSRGITSNISIDGSSYASPIKTIQYTTGTVKAEIERTSPTGSTADVTVELSVYDGSNFDSNELESENFTLTYTEDGTAHTVSKNSFSYSSGKYTYQLTGLNYKKEITWSITGTDKIGNTLSGNNGNVSIGLPAFNAFIDDGKNYMVINGKLVLMTSTDTYILLEPVIVDTW